MKGAPNLYIAAHFVALILAAGGVACIETESLGRASVPCDSGACAARGVVSDDAYIPDGGAETLEHTASLLHGTFLGQISGSAADSDRLILSFDPSADPLTGRFSVGCSAADGCASLLTNEIAGTYVLTGIGKSGFANGYLVVEGSSTRAATEIMGIVFTSDNTMFFTLGDASQLWVAVAASRISDSAPSGTGLARDGGMP